LGALVANNDLSYKVEMKKVSSMVKIFLEEKSVTGTENMILVSSLSSRPITLKNCAQEPHVVDLCRMLVAMGVSIEGIGTDTLIITGKEFLNGTEFRIGVDHIEVGTYAIAVMITGGKLEIEGVSNADLDAIVTPLSKFGLIFEQNGDKLNVFSDGLKSVEKIFTNTWPGFPTDLMSAVIVLATQSNGVTLCHDWMFESRMFFVDKLISMGANIIIADPHRVFVSGPTHLRGRELESPDIRAGMALVLAALVADGKSVINKAELIERGYEDAVGKLQSLGADIKKVV